MFGIVAALIFAVAFLLSLGTMAYMFATYHGKMTAALLFRPMPDPDPVYHVEIRRPRADAVPARAEAIPFALAA